MTFWVTFFLWAVSFVITDYFRQRLPQQTPAGLGDFSVPTATEGRFVPLCFGTMLVQGPNVVWYGDFSSQERTVETGIIFKEDETIGYTYFMSMQMVCFRGRTAGIRRIWIGDDIVWDYTTDNGGNPGLVCDVNVTDLFGGENEGGGFVGRFRVYDGSQTAVSPYLATQIASTILPSYQNYVYIVMTNLTEDGGANIGESNTLRRMKFEFQNFETVANGALGDALGLGNDHHIIGDDLNPVSLAYEVFTNTDWGRGLSPADINITNFKAAAETVWTDGYGFSILIDQVMKSSEMLDLIEHHIDGYIGPNPETGLMEVNLARQDYSLTASPEEVFFADETNVIKVTKFSRGENNQTFNEVRVQFLDRAKEYKDTYAPAQDLANLAIQGRPRSRINRMSGCHDRTVANKLAWRDLRGASRPLATATVEINRTGWNLRPGDVIALTDDEVGVSLLPMRITAIRQGDPLNASILLDVVEDVFGNEELGLPDPPTSQFVPPTDEVFPFAQEEMLGIEAPYIINIQDLSTPNVYPRLVTGAYAKNAGDIRKYTASQFITANSPQWTDIGSVTGTTFTRVGRLRSTLGSWAANNGTFTVGVDPFSLGSPGDDSLQSLVGTYAPGGVGSLEGCAVINPGQYNEEWIIFDTVVAGGSPTTDGGIDLQNVWRGALDSAMLEHAAGEPIWFVWTGGLLMPSKQFSVGDTPDVKLLPSSITDEILPTESPIPPSIGFGSPLGGGIEFDTDFARYEKPPVPISIALNGVEFGSTVDLDTQLSVSPAVQGVSVVPVYRQWNNTNVALQVQGAYQDGGTIPDSFFTDHNYRVSWWFYNIDESGQNPSRTIDALASGDEAVLSQGQIIELNKDNLSPTPLNNTFNARLEIEVSHTPPDALVNNPTSPGQRVSREVMNWDFEASGLFIIPASAVWIDMNFTSNTPDAYGYNDRGYYGTSGWRPGGYIRQVTNPNTSSPTMFGTYVAQFDNDQANRASLLYLRDPDQFYDGDWFYEGDFTIEFQIAFNINHISSQTVFARHSIAYRHGVHRWFYLQYDGSQDRWEILTTSTGTNTVTQVCHLTATWVPILNQVYDVAITRKKNTVTGNWELQTFIDGVKLGDTNIVADLGLPAESPDSEVELCFGGYQPDRPFGSGGGPSSDLYAELSYFRILTLPFRQIDYVPEQALPEINSHIGFYWSPRTGMDFTTETAEIYIPSTDGRETKLLIDDPGQVRSDIVPIHPFGDNAGFYSLRGYGRDSTSAQLVDGMRAATYVMNLANLNWSMECHVKFAVIPSVENSGAEGGTALLSQYNRPSGNSVDWLFYFDETDKLTWRGWDGGNISSPNRILAYDLSGQLSTGVWYHCAAERIGQSLALYFEGELVAYDANHFEGWTNPISANNLFAVGRLLDVSTTNRSRAINGWIAEPTVWVNANAPHLGLSTSPELTGSPTSIPSPPRPTYTIPTSRMVEPRRGIVTKVPSFGDDYSGRWINHCRFACHFEPLSPLNTAIDRSPVGKTVTFINGAQVVSGVHPFLTSPDDGTKGALDFSGNAGSPKQSVSIPGDIELDFNHRYDDFTVEAWVYWTTGGRPGSGGSPEYGDILPSEPSPRSQAFIIGMWRESGNDENWRLLYDDFHGWTFEYTDSGLGGVNGEDSKYTSTRTTFNEFPYTGTSPGVPIPNENEWIHVRACRQGGNIRIFVNGVLAAEGCEACHDAPSSSTTPIYIGCGDGASNDQDAFIGYITEVRILSDFADGMYGFTVPTEPFSYYDVAFHLGWHGPPAAYRNTENWAAAVEQTSEVESMAWQHEQLIYETNASYNTLINDPWDTGEPFLATYSSLADINFASQTEMDLADGDWTIEGWIYFPNTQYLTDASDVYFLTKFNTIGYAFGYRPSTDEVQFAWTTNNTSGTVYRVLWGWTPSPETKVWHHLAVVRDGTFIRLYVDGVEQTITNTENLSISPAPGSPEGQVFIQSPNAIDFDTGELQMNCLNSNTLNAEAFYVDWMITKRCRYFANFTTPNRRSKVY